MKMILTFALKPIPDTNVPEDCCRTLWSALDWLIDWDAHKVKEDIQYAVS